MNGCCMIETRLIPNLLEIIQERHLNYVPKDWGLTLFLSEQNKHLIREDMFQREVKIYLLPDVFNEFQYNHLLTSVSFWDKLPYENVLIFQTDSELLKEGIENYLHFDFIGAPHKQDFPMMNGGLSLRDVEKCKSICKRWNYDGGVNEDWYFCKWMPQVLGVLPTFNEAESFAVETTFNIDSLGAHAIDKHLNSSQCKCIRNQYLK